MEKCLKWPQMGPGGFFPTNLALTDILGKTDLDVDNFYFWIFWDPKFADFQVPDFQISRNLAEARLGPGRAWAYSSYMHSPGVGQDQPFNHQDQLLHTFPRDLDGRPRGSIFGLYALPAHKLITLRAGNCQTSH